MSFLPIKNITHIFSTVPPPSLGRFDFPKFCLIFAPGVSIISFCIYRDLGEVSDIKNENCLEAKNVSLYSKNRKKFQKIKILYNKTGHFASRQFLTLRSDTSPRSFKLH